jgi:UDP-glucose 4-epimerase
VSAIICAINHPKAVQQTFNICMDERVDYGMMAAYFAEKYQLSTVGIQTEFYSNWLDNSKAKFLLGWQPVYDLKKIIDAA